MRKEKVTKTVLYNLLYFNDFNYYELRKIKMTGETYAKLRHGPFSRHFDEIVQELKSENAVGEVKEYCGSYQCTRYFSLKEPTPSLLTADELCQIDDTIERYKLMNATEILEHSHKDIPWIAANEKQSLDYENVFSRSVETSVRP